ncbi:MAG: FkbM family methyltransferase [Nanopusillaceae archaeon]
MSSNLRKQMIDKLRKAFDVFITDPVLFTKEILRRISNKSYTHKGFLINNTEDFRFVYGIKKYKKEWSIIKEKESFYLFNKKYNVKFWIPKDKIGLYSVVMFEKNLDLEQYDLKKEEICNKRVLDVGAYVGDTVLGFILKGAKYVVGIEPVYYDVAKKNLEINNIKNAEIRDYGLADRDIEYGVTKNLSATGLKEGDFKIKTKSWEEILKNEKFDLAKVDCEGCELYLLTVSDELLRKIPLWVMEIHGAYLPLVNKFKRAGFEPKLVKRFSDLLTIWKFKLI